MNGMILFVLGQAVKHKMVTIQWLKTSNKENKHSKRRREKKDFIYRRTKIRITSDFWWKPYKQEATGGTHLKYWRKKTIAAMIPLKGKVK